MTKKILTLVAGLFLATTAVQAEQYNDAPRSEISVSYGFLPGCYVYDAVKDGLEAIADIMMSTILTAGYADAKVEGKVSTGSINVDYNYHLSPGFAIGINGSYSEAHGDINAINIQSNSQPTKVGTSKRTYINVMPNVKFDWMRHEHFSMYTRLSVGVAFVSSKKEVTVGTKESESSNPVYFSGQISPIGMEFGGINFRGFAEFGFGQAGVIQAGIRTRF